MVVSDPRDSKTGRPRGGMTRLELLYHFCRLQFPDIALSFEKFERHLERTLALYQSKSENGASWDSYVESLYPLDWYLAVGCLESEPQAWEHLFAARAGR